LRRNARNRRRASHRDTEETERRTESILWDRGSIIDAAGTASPVLHSGVRFINADQAVPPTAGAVTADQTRERRTKRLSRKPRVTVRDQFVRTLVHEAAHVYWTYQMKYFDPSGGHHDKWEATMRECGLEPG
jgi:hypothetical protein